MNQPILLSKAHVEAGTQFYHQDESEVFTVKKRFFRTLILIAPNGYELGTISNITDDGFTVVNFIEGSELSVFLPFGEFLIK